MLDVQASYEAVRITAGVCRRPGRTWWVSGRQRMEFVQTLLEADVSPAADGACFESAVVDDKGRPVGMAVALVGDDRVDLVIDAPSEWFDTVMGDLSGHDVTVGESSQTAAQVEGPWAWKVVADLIGDRDICQVAKHEWVPAEVDGASAMLARTGTTGEHGYLVLTSADNVIDVLTAKATQVGGGLIDPAVLPRLWIEAGYPAAPGRLGLLSQPEAGVHEWVSSAHATVTAGTPSDEANGKIVIEPPQSLDIVTRHCVPMFFKDADCPPVDATATADGEIVGRVVVHTPRAGQPDGLGVVMLDDRYTEPGTNVQVGPACGRVVAQPLIEPLSRVEEVGAAAVTDPPASCCGDAPTSCCG